MADNYRIVAQKQNIELNPAGAGFLNVWEITYQVTAGPARGTTATITVPQSDYNAAYVKKEIESVIKHHDEVASL